MKNDVVKMIKNLKILNKQIPKKLNGYRGGLYKLCNGIAGIQYDGRHAIIQLCSKDYSTVCMIHNNKRTVDRDKIICLAAWESIKSI